ncbi:hypothetical protein QAD02_020238 [Eretmocerus hayati]|uniref:Uncharacterized protein n=1 Tax=Eretmocerus hayati TaxID=131215 RepID=A0ACC2PNR2_9HYME|nr:hypothetical protein QAD02_020238 [Eretmocerus hayati]
MKILLMILSILGLIALIRGDSDSEDLESYHLCLKEKNIKEGDIEKLQERDDPRLHCIMACVLEKEGVLKNDLINEVALKKDALSYAPKVEESKVSEIIDTCLDLGKDVKDICDKVNILTLCVEEEFEKLGTK